MSKKILILAGLALAGLFAGVAARGYSDSKGWTKGTV
jgi:hypothetical protein